MAGSLAAAQAGRWQPAGAVAKAACVLCGRTIGRILPHVELARTACTAKIAGALLVYPLHPAAFPACCCRALREVQEAVPKAAVDFFECDLGSLQ